MRSAAAEAYKDRSKETEIALKPLPSLERYKLFHIQMTLQQISICLNRHAFSALLPLLILLTKQELTDQRNAAPASFSDSTFLQFTYMN